MRVKILSFIFIVILCFNVQAGQQQACTGEPAGSACSYSSQDFSTYSETDPDSKITITSSKVSWASILGRNSEAHVTKDRTSRYFSGDITVRFTATTGTVSADYGRMYLWAVGNESGGLFAIK